MEWMEWMECVGMVHSGTMSIFLCLLLLPYTVLSFFLGILEWNIYKIIHICIVVYPI